MPARLGSNDPVLSGLPVIIFIMEAPEPTRTESGAHGPEHPADVARRAGHTIAETPETIGTLTRRRCTTCGAAYVTSDDGRSWGAALDESCPIVVALHDGTRGGVR